ncbi:single-stranded DNA binding protein [Campylobacter pinnipediorum subsp. caledonicus]|uniref:Single-stranded DNA-binding protein n=1 Tax=Campylobacter pinnipediorum subsp. caledonicus TaxID=1874362 RepID=A0A1S6U969_9BACT|nr:single-stranded DNA-binding protein [Campylobacter pinnipediorum]AQW88286.1 single-stranded DNA binding protein [Campylobacter pinnipediorum subsp. caledonicus]
MFNKVVLVGNLTRDIELRYTTTGVAIGNSGIAVTRKFTTNGEKREETCFIDISFFGKQAEIANQYLSKGSKLLVEGRLKLDQWTDSNGQNRSKHSVSVENMEMLGGGNQMQNQGGGFNQNQGWNNQQSYDNQSYNNNNNYGKQNNFNNQEQTPAFNKQNNDFVKTQQNNKFDDTQDINDEYDSDDSIPF